MSPLREILPMSSLRKQAMASFRRLITWGSLPEEVELLWLVFWCFITVDIVNYFGNLSHLFHEPWSSAIARVWVGESSLVWAVELVYHALFLPATCPFA